MKKASCTLFSNMWVLMLTGALTLFLNQQASAQCSLVCNDFIQVSLDEDCYVEILPDMVLEGGNNCPNGNLVVEMKVNGAWIPAVASNSNINQTVQVRVRDLNSGNSCWGYMHVEDKLPPIIECTDFTIPCAEDNFDPAYLYNTLGINEAYPFAEDNCSTPTLTFIDTWYDLPCGLYQGQDLSAYVKRVWTATDPSGNHSTCTQYIYLKRYHVYEVDFPADVTVDCSDPSTTPATTGAPYITFNGVDYTLYPDEVYCELNVTYQDQILPVCDGTYKILRTWTVYDWCLPTSPFPPTTNPLYYIQLIKVLDSEGPVVDCPEDMTIGTNPFDCERDFDLPDVIIADNCSQIQSIKAQWTDLNGVGHTITGTLTSFPGNNLWNPDTLGVLGYANNLPIGTTEMKYIVTDDCGNSTTCVFDITVEDDTPPTAVCQQVTQVALGSNGMALVNASSFNSGSYDNCSPVTFKARRMNLNACQDPEEQYFHDQVKFCCEDIGDTILVVFRVYDVPVPAGDVDLEFEEWHSNDCMVQVLVEDKLKPVCNAPANKTVSCENFDPTLWAYGTATAEDNCCIDTITATANYSLFDTVCNRGTITRTFRAYDCAGLSSQCTQRVFVNYEQDYYIKFPNDVIVTVCDGTGNYGEPTFFGEDCELLGVSFQDEVFTVVPDACFKIERTWNIINWCTYNTNLPCVYVPNPNPNPITNSTQNLPGPIVSAPGTLAPWAPTNVKVNPSDPQPTNYSVFYTGGTYNGISIPSIANNNCFTYKQIIKVIDTQAPTATCPASPVTFCDLTVNNPQLWNEMYWWDGVIGQHDLCEGPSDLQITATDACSGANINIEYLLFLDLDGDGIMETVVSSTNLPGVNNVQYGNASNPNFSGGTPRAFDERGVPTNQKYRFNIDRAKSGNNLIAAVRWDTQSQQINPTNTTLDGVVPELPYGTHKIKWILSDGCGNQSVCEYTFVVKDCKAPTVVCFNGLSVNIMPTGMVTLWATDFLQYAEDNCTPPTPYTPGAQLKYAIRKSGQGTGFPVDAFGQPITNVTFTCDEVGTQPVELWAQDAAGNAAYCETYVIIQDPFNNCNNPNGPSANVAGAAKVNFNDPNMGVEDVNIGLDGVAPNGLPPVSTFMMTSNIGLYNFNAVPVAGNYTVTPLKDDNPMNGVSTFDLVLMSKHILGIEPLNSPYKIIAADINKNNSVTTFDIVELRKLILGIYSELPNNTSWRFVQKDFAFNNPSNPFADSWPEVYQISDLQSGGFNSGDFAAVKVGDLNGSVVPNSLVSAEDRSNGTIFFDLLDRDVKAGETFEVSLKTADKTAGYQFTLNLDGLEATGIVPGENMTTDNFAIFSDAITSSVDGNAGEFTVKFRATKAGKLSEMLSIGSRITRAEAYNDNGDRYDVALRFNGANGSVVSGAGFELLQNTPNPVQQRTTITFNLPEAADATLTITNAEGRVIKTVQNSFQKGLNTITLNRAELEAGILFYQIATPTHSAVKKMIVVE